MVYLFLNESNRSNQHLDMCDKEWKRVMTHVNFVIGYENEKTKEQTQSSL